MPVPGSHLPCLPTPLAHVRVRRVQVITNDKVSWIQRSFCFSTNPTRRNPKADSDGCNMCCAFCHTASPVIWRRRQLIRNSSQVSFLAQNRQWSAARIQALRVSVTSVDCRVATSASPYAHVQKCLAFVRDDGCNVVKSAAQVAHLRGKMHRLSLIAREVNYKSADTRLLEYCCI